jgi:hemoglobin
VDHIVDEAALPVLLERFYALVRADAELGPVFEAAIDDWPAHLARLADFWSSIMLTSGRYKGNPTAKHLRHADRITAPMFDRWLALWRQATAERLSTAAAAAMVAKAERIAESLKLALDLRTAEGRRAMLERRLAPQP